MSLDVVIGRAGATGVVTLDRPRAINALTTAMVEAMTRALEEWAKDPAVKAVLIEGRGGKGFCAGGDVRAVRALLETGDTAEAETFFAREYALNALVATYAKPIVALQDGVVMGGGIGLSSHARYRVCTPASRFAMPEAAIGFFADVGVNAILARAPESIALAFLLTGTVVGAADAIRLGLSDTMVPATELEALRARILDAAHAGEIDTAIASVLQAESVDPGPPDFCLLAESLADCFEPATTAAIVEALQVAAEDGEVGAAALAAAIAGHCPTSLAVILAAHRLARRQRDIAAVLATDRKLASFMIARPDFAEGVRALLVDRDRKPRWQPSRHAEVDTDAIAAVLASSVSGPHAPASHAAKLPGRG